MKWERFIMTNVWATALVASFVVMGQIAGCGAEAPSEVAGSAQVAGETTATAETGERSSSRKIVMTAQVDVLVENWDAAYQDFKALTARLDALGGYISHQELHGTAGSRRYGTWTIRVPQPHFDKFLVDVEQLGELQRNTRDAQDVTEAYTDLAARLHNMQASEQRLLSHLEKTGELKDTLEVERELSRVRGEVERLQGQLNVLTNKTTLATIILTLHERQGFVPQSSPTFATQASRTFSGSLQALGAFGRVCALLLIGVSPWLCVAVPAGGAIWAWKRRRLSSS